MHGDAHRMTEIGFAGYVTKPIKRLNLMQCLLQVLGTNSDHDRQDSVHRPLVTQHAIKEENESGARVFSFDYCIGSFNAAAAPKC